MNRAPEHPARPRGPTGDLPRASLRLNLDGHSATRVGPLLLATGTAFSPVALRPKNLGQLSQA